MPLTISVTIDDDAIVEFIDQYNKDADVKINADMLNQNDDLHQTFATDMINAWFDSLWDNDGSPYDTYCEFFEHDELDEELNELDEELKG